MKMMRRCILLLVSVATLLCACSNEADEVACGCQPSTVPVAFDVATDSAVTRAVGDINNTDALQNGTGFGVFACYTGNLKYEYTSVQPDFMCNQQVKWAASAWIYEPVKYWPNQASDYVTFFAYAPYEQSPDGTKCIAEFSKTDDLGDPWLVYKLAQNPWSTTNGQVDLLYGINEGSMTDATDDQPWYDQQKSGYDIGSKLKFTFKHALACIGDQMQISIDDDLSALLDGGAYAKLYIERVEINYTNLTSKARLILNSKGQPNWRAIVSGDVTVSRTLTITRSAVPEEFRAADSGLTVEAYKTYYGAHTGLTEYLQEIVEGKGLYYIPLNVAGEQLYAVTLDYQIINNVGQVFVGSVTSKDNVLAITTDAIGKKSGINLILTKDLDLKHNVYVIDDSATEPSYARQQ